MAPGVSLTPQKYFGQYANVCGKLNNLGKTYIHYLALTLKVPVTAIDAL